MRLSRYLLLVCLLCPAFACGQGFQIRDVAQKLVNGNYQPAIGASVTVCTSAGTGIPCTPLASIYVDKALTQPSANPIIIGTSSNSDALGNFNFYVSPTASYVVTLTGSGFTGRSSTYQLACPTDVNCTFTGTITFSGAVTASGTTTITDLNGGKYVDGTKYATLAAADAACVAAVSCVIDMRGNSTALALGTFDPGSTIPTTVLLGPYGGYTLTQLILRTGLKIYGMRGFTVITSTSTSTDMVVLGTGSGAIQAVRLDGFNIQCGAGNASQIAFHIVVPVGVGGLWYSDFWDLIVGGGGTNGCGGGEFLFDGNNGGATGLNQFIDFYRVRAFRPTNGAPVFRATGLNGQFSFNQSEFDGPTPNDSNKTNFQIDDGTQTFRAPYSFGLNNVTIQQAAGVSGVGILLQGVTGVEINSGHYENISGVIKATTGTHFGSWGTIVSGSTFDLCGASSGSGFIVSTDASSSVSFSDNDIFGTPDALFAGTSTKYVSSRGTTNHSAGSLQPAPANNRPVGGFDKDGPALKAIRSVAGCATGASVGGACTTVVTWTTAFADANYTPQCVGFGITSGVPVSGGITAILAASVTFQTVATTAAAAQYTNISCTAVHD